MAVPTMCIPIPHRDEGGLYTFLANFRAYLDAAGLPHTERLDDPFDVLFVNSWVVPAEVVRSIKAARPDVRVVHRVDGAARDYGRYGGADEAQRDVNRLADLTIFQSHYARFSCREKHHVISGDGPVIPNAVDVGRFHPAPDAARLDRPRIACVTWSTNAKKGAAGIAQLGQRHPEYQFVLCGRYETVADAPNVERHGPLRHDALAGVLRSCHVLLFLSENEACPNVVLEGLASGLPIAYRHSGGVPELVGDAGEPVGVDESFPATVASMMCAWPDRSRAARARAVAQFAPDVIFPRYLEAIARCSRRSTAPPARSGTPVPGLPRLRASAQRLADRVAARVPALDRRARRTRPVQIGWITADSFPDRKRRLSELDSFGRIRTGHMAAWINRASDLIWNELYRPGERYDVVVFQKVMGEDALREAQAIQKTGGRVVFDANVNYYEIWGDYFIPGTQPTADQQRDAIAMTRLADWVVADSTYLQQIIRPLNANVTWIPDNVDLSLYAGIRQHADTRPVRLVWSGVGKKAAHLLAIRDVLASLAGFELLLVTDSEPDCLRELRACLPCLVQPFSDSAYARALLSCDIIISPKRTINAYEMGHTEYKIALGMAVGLPAVASPQQSYVEILSHGGGIVAQSSAEWLAALTELGRDPARRRALGARARETVRAHYSTPIVARRYLSLLERLAADRVS
jgi:glycosyltransferase involved in cell wall biosynthesis